MKITYSAGNINSFGGLNFADYIINKSSLYGINDNELGDRGENSVYCYSDLICYYLFLTLCGGRVCKDITENLCRELEQVRGFSPCSADTLLWI